MDTVIVQMLARENEDGTTHSFIEPGLDATETILDWADTNQFKVYLGLYLHRLNGSLAMTGSGFLNQALADNVGVASQAWQRYLQHAPHPSFAGWYVPLEPWTADYSPAETERLGAFFRGVRDGCRAVAGEYPVAASPFINGQPAAPCRVTEVYKQILGGGGIDLLLVQDGVGAQQWENNLVFRVAPYYEAFREACAATGVTLWANLESFRVAPAGYQSCDIDRFRRQIDAAAPFVSGFVTFDLVHYLNPDIFLPAWDEARRDSMRRLFAEYQAECVAQDHAPFAAPRVKAALHGQEVRLAWEGTPGDDFQVHSAAGLGSSDWIVVAGLRPTNGPPFSVSVPLESGAGARFLRLQRQPRLRVPDSMVWIPPGEFVMGTPAADPHRTPDELTEFSVNLTRGFWVGRTEVTQFDYQALMCTNPAAFTGDLERPVERVSWEEAVAYCGRLTQRERAADRLPPGYTYRLPTEAEWEYAARAGTTTGFSWGDEPDALPTYGWFSANSASVTHPVGQRTANPWGLHDVQGNVFEWCFDWLGAVPGGAVTNLVGTVGGAYQAIRGGAWSGAAWSCRSSWRLGYAPNQRQADVGFRVVLVVNP